MDTALSALVAQVREAAAGHAPLRIRGGGTKDFYGEPGGLGALLSTSSLSGIVAYEPSELVVTVRTGTPLAVLESALAAQGQCLPFEPPRFREGGTVGGMVAAGLSGPARASVGAVRDYVLGLQLVNGRGEHLVFGGQVMKNVAGYDVSRLMVGAMGTLGLITEVSLKVLPIAPAEATLSFELPQAEALAHLNAWGGQPLPLNASRWCDEGGRPRLDLRLRGAAAAVEAAVRRLGGERQPDAGPAWEAVRDHRLPWFAPRAGQGLWRLSVPQTAPVLDLPEPTCIEWHGAQRWVWAEAEAGAADRVRAAAQAAGGHATLFADNAATAPVQRFPPLPAPIDRIHRELKQAFDPAGIFNPGRLYATL